MGTTPNGLPYPEPSDDLRNGADAIEALATSLDVTGTASMVTNVALLTGFTGSLTVQRVGGLVVVSGDVNGTIATGPVDFAAVGAIPAELRPVVLSTGISYLGNGHPAATFVRDNGSVGIANMTTGNQGRARFTIVYPLASL